MEKYTVLKPLTFPCGKIGLTEKQAEPRAEFLKKVKKGVFEIMAPITFKAGEVVGLLEVSKAHLPNLGKVATILDRDKE